MQQQLLVAIKDKSARVGIIGLGYVGLPLAGAFIAAGFRVLGFDVDEAKVDQLNNGESYIKHIASETVAGWIAGDRFEATCLQARMAEADVLLICVPTPLTGALSAACGGAARPYAGRCEGPLSAAR